MPRESSLQGPTTCCVSVYYRGYHAASVIQHHTHCIYIYSIIFLIHKTDCITLGFIDSTSKLGAAEQVAYKMQIPNNINSDRDDVQEIQDEQQ